MPKEVLYATGFFEIGDTFIDKDGNTRVVTDILVCHYLKDGAFKVLYEVDNSGLFEMIKFQGFDAEEKPEQKRNILQMPTPVYEAADDGDQTE